MRIRLLVAFAFSLLAVSQSAFASVMILEVSKFRCFDGREYNVVRHYTGGWGPGRWGLAAFCNLGILTQNEYNGRVFQARDSHPEMAACIAEESPALRQCLNEFVQINGSRGGELSPILHSQRAPEPLAHPTAPQPGTRIFPHNPQPRDRTGVIR